MQKKRLTILLNGLLILSLLLPSLPAQAGTSTPEPTPTQTVEASPEPIPPTPSTTHTVIATTYIGDDFEWSGSTSTMKKYYSAGGMRLAVRTGDTLNWLLGDHLGSTNITADGSGIQVGKLMYKPWSEERFSSGTTPTTFKFTGQRQESSFGLYLFGSRWYDQALGRWAQPDSIVPNPYNPTDWDRYGYVLNNPLRYNDPSGHTVACPSENGNGCEGFGPARILETYGYDTDRTDETLRNFIRSHENYSFLKDPDLDDTTRYLVSNAQFQVFAEESRIDSWLSSGAGLALSAMIANGGASNPGGINGASDHRAGVKYVEQLAREQFPLSEGFSYFYNRSIKSFNGGIDRRPDLTVWHGDDLVYIYEVGRTNRNGSALLPREQRKMFEYWENGLRYFFHLLKTKR